MNSGPARFALAKKDAEPPLVGIWPIHWKIANRTRGQGSRPLKVIVADCIPTPSIGALSLRTYLNAQIPNEDLT